jgi:DNA polymerase-3 subunit delta'
MAKFVPTIHPWNQQTWQNITNEPERSNHALLFTGNQGLGKQSLAFALAHFVLCDTHSQSESLFNAGSHPDLHVIMAENQVVELAEDDLMARFAKRYLEHHTGKPKRTISIEQIRTLSQALTTHPHISSHRVILIVGAEQMNRNAANALLKSLEEPPANTLFIIVSDEISRLAKTVRSRCSLIPFRAPDAASAQAWLEQQGDLPAHEVINHLSMANNHPLLAFKLYKEGYIDSLKSVFTDVNGLWNQRREPVQVAKNWQEIGALISIDILQKLSADLLKNSLSDNPQSLFFPVQETWVKSVSAKLSRQKILDVIDSLNYAKRMLSTTVDQLLVLETVSNDFRKLAIV